MQRLAILPSDKLTSVAGKALTSLKSVWYVDTAKGLDIGDTYLNKKTVLGFIYSIADTEQDRATRILGMQRARNNLHF